MIFSSVRNPSVRASNALPETLACAIVSKAFSAKGKGGALGERAIGLEMIRRAISLVPPPAGISPTPVSTSPM